MKFYFWLARRMLLTKDSQLFSLSGINALVGLMLGVACLVVSMAVMSGFELTLQRSVADVTGHIQILMRVQDLPAKAEFLEKVRKIEPTLLAGTRFALIEGVMANQGKLSGVSLQGLDNEDVGQVLGIEKRLVEGKLDLTPSQADGSGNSFDNAAIGLGLAKTLGLKIGDSFRVVVPLRNELDPNQFRRKVGVFKVVGILDLGKYDYNQRMILTSLKATQKIAEIGERYSGVLLKFQNIDRAREISTKLTRELGGGFVVRDWRDVNENLFEAVQIERVVVFFVILVIILAAAFNVASTLYINVVTRFAEIGLLKALGLSQKGILKVFSLQGMILGSIGLLAGLVLGILLCFLVTFIENYYGIVPGSIYHLDKIELAVRWQDVLSISVVTLLICFLATLAPAFRGAQLTPVEGLRNE